MTARLQLRLGLVPKYPPPAKYRVAGGGDTIVDGWLSFLRRSGADYHLASRILAELPHISEGGVDAPRRAAEDLVRATVDCSKADCRAGPSHRDDLVVQLQEWIETWQGRLALEEGQAEAAPGGTSNDDDDDNGALWRRQIRGVVPRYVLRTPFLRQLTNLVESTQATATAGTAAAPLVEAALRVVSDPFDRSAWSGWRKWRRQPYDDDGNDGGNSGDHDQQLWPHPPAEDELAEALRRHSRIMDGGGSDGVQQEEQPAAKDGDDEGGAEQATPSSSMSLKAIVERGLSLPSSPWDQLDARAMATSCGGQ